MKLKTEKYGDGEKKGGENRRNEIVKIKLSCIIESKEEGDSN